MYVEKAGLDGPAPGVRDEPNWIGSSAPAPVTRVLLAEDHPLYCDGLHALLRGQDDFEILGEAHTPLDALLLARQQQPTLVLLDLELAGELSLDLVGQLRRVCPKLKVVILTTHHDNEHLMAAVRLGVDGFLRKDMAGAAILSGLRAVSRGQRVLGQAEAVTAVLDEFTRLLREHERELLGLNETELEILRLAAAGLNNREIGVQKFWSEITVKRKTGQIYRKMNVKTRAQAVAEAIRLGLL